jgi:hypothetical protein
MGLLEQQEALAAILMQAPQRKSFATDPQGTLRALGLKGKDLDLLATLDADDLAYFATRRNIDRHQALRADAPLTMRLLESTRGRVQAYFRAHPFSLEDPRDEVVRFARWCVRAAKDGTVPALAPDIARYEAAVLRLLTQPAKAIRPSAKPKRTPQQVRFEAAHRLHEALRSEGAPKATPGVSYVVVHRVPDDVKWHIVTALEAALIDSADGKRTEQSWLAAAAKAAGATVAQAKAAAAGLRKDGLIAPSG